VYQQFFVANSNFKANHVCQKHTSEIWLSEGAGMMANRDEYTLFLENAKEHRTVCVLLVINIIGNS